MDRIPILILGAIWGGIALIFLFKQPYLGVAFTVASLPIVDLLPDIPYLSSVVPLVGGLTVVAYLLKKRETPLGPRFTLTALQTIGLLFLFWIFISNPQAAWLGRSRNWVFTFLQLWVLLYLAGEMLDTPRKHQVVMVIFSITAIISAFYAIQTGAIGESFDTSIRSEGFVDNENAAARFFVVAMVFLTYIRSSLKDPLLRFFSLIGIGITYFGVFYTLSRTGMVLLFAAQGLILFFQTEGKQRIGLVFLFLIALVGLWFISENIFDIMGTILPTVTRGEDTMGLRYNLWKSGILMWLDHPLRGVGIGRYIEEVGPYIWSMKGERRWNSVTHNTYIQVLSETGIVGFGLFIAMIGISLKNFWKDEFREDSQNQALRTTWLIAFLVMLIGGITKSDHADKLTWMVMGLSVYFTRGRPVDEAVHDENHPDSVRASRYLKERHI